MVAPSDGRPAPKEEKVPQDEQNQRYFLEALHQLNHTIVEHDDGDQGSEEVPGKEAPAQKQEILQRKRQEGGLGPNSKRDPREPSPGLKAAILKGTTQATTLSDSEDEVRYNKIKNSAVQQQRLKNSLVRSPRESLVENTRGAGGRSNRPSVQEAGAT